MLHKEIIIIFIYTGLTELKVLYDVAALINTIVIVGLTHNLREGNPHHILNSKKKIDW